MPETRLIDADKAIAEIERIYCDDCDSHNGVMCRACGYQDAMDIIDDSPTVDAVPVNRGHWIEVRKHRDADGYIVTDYKCSECGIVLRDTNPDDRDSEFYCYHCGAKMDGGDADA